MQPSRLSLVQALEIRIHFAGIAPQSVAGDTFLLNMIESGELYHAGRSKILFSPVTNNLFWDDVDPMTSGLTGGPYTYHTVSKSLARGTVLSLSGVRRFSMHWDTANAGTIIFGQDTDEQTATFSLLSTVPPPAHFSPDFGRLAIFGTNSDDVITQAMGAPGTSNEGKLITTRNGTIVNRQRLSKIKELDLLAGNGNDKVTVLPELKLLVSSDQLSGAYVAGGGGNDTLVGSKSRDRLDGGDGSDRVYGGSGNDLVLGGTGNDKLYGEAGNDTIKGNSGADTVDGGTGTDNGLIDASDTKSSIEKLLS
jgi:Ca2+-binding RTX toxin-like protein